MMVLATSPLMPHTRPRASMNDAAAVPTSTPPSALSTGVNRGGGCGETPT